MSRFWNGYGLDIGVGDPAVTGNTIEDSKYGLYIRGGAAEIGVDSTAAANTITGTTRGISTTCTGAGTCPTCSGFNPRIRNCNITGNYHGVVAEKRGSLVNLGEGGDRGVNNIYDNTVYCVWNRSVCANDAVWAVGNYWGGCDGNEFPVVCWEGDIIADGYKCTGPDAIRVPMGIVEVKPFRVLGVAPNPVTRSAQVRLAIAGEGARVGVRIFDVTGRLVRTIQEQQVDPGVHELTWDGRTEAGPMAGAGIYFVRVTANNCEHETVKVLVLR